VRLSKEQSKLLDREIRKNHPAEGAELTLDVNRWVEKLGVQDPEECVEWHAIWSHGYGMICIQGQRMTVPRAVLMSSGFDMSDLVTRHGCDNRACIRHVKPGTHADNNRDMWERGRAIEYGDSHHAAKLSTDIVKEIRSRYIRFSRTDGSAAIAREYGIHPRYMNQVLNGEGWRH
jgi:hypothetical protein